MFFLLIIFASTIQGLFSWSPLSSMSTKVPVAKRVKANNIEISEMGCGTWSWGNRLLWDYDPNQDEMIYESYKYIRSAGISIFDTADSYGTLDLNGRAEILLGEFERRYIKERGEVLEEKKDWLDIFSKENPVQPQQVATKFAPYPWRVTPNQMVQAARSSLNRLGQEKLSIAQLHWSTANYQPLQEKALWQGIGDVYDEGLCDAVGVSNYGPLQLQKISDYMKSREVPLATAQIQYSLMTYKDSKDMNECCNENGCRLISYSPLCLGLLTGKYNLDNLPKNGNPRRQLFRELLPGAQTLLNTLEAIAIDLDKTQSQIALNWALCKDTVPIPGVRTLEQAEENIGALEFRLSSDMVDALDKAALDLKKPMIQNIFQTK